jgi:hypothetical protein
VVSYVVHSYHDNCNIIFVLQMMIMWSVTLYMVTMTIIILYLYYRWWSWWCGQLRCTWLPWQLLAHLTQRVRWAIVTTERLSSVRPSVNFSHFNQLLWNHWANLNQTLVEWSLDGPLPKLCPVIPTSNQDGRQAKNRKKGGWNFNCSLLL